MKSVIFTSNVFIKSLFITIVIFLIPVSSALGLGPLVDFDEIAPSTMTTPNTSNAAWTYSERGSGQDMWTSLTEIGSTGHFMTFYRYRNTANNDHIGWESWGYSDISNSFSRSGNSFHTRITGGKSSEFPDGSGAPIYGKQDFLDYVGDPNSGEDLGQPYFYFSTTSTDQSTIFPGASGADELSAYIYMPSTVYVDSGADRPIDNISFGPFLSGESSHYYTRFGVNGGGWAHVIVDNHPQHKNTWSSDDRTPYDGYAIRSYAPEDFIQKFAHMYIALQDTITPNDFYIDDLEFRVLSGETNQNFETLNSPAIAYYPDEHFEVSIRDKYTNLQSGVTIEGRYSFSPITNANWDSATLIDVQEYSGGFTITEIASGQFRKTNRYYKRIWAPFKVQSADQSLLTPGTTIYFAFKDVGNLDGSGVPTQSCASFGCRDYTSGNFDWAGDSAVLKNIRAIDYVINRTVDVGIQPARDLKIVY